MQAFLTPGLYLVYANSVGPGETGDCTVSVTAEAVRLHRPDRDACLPAGWGGHEVGRLRAARRTSASAVRRLVVRRNLSAMARSTPRAPAT